MKKILGKFLIFILGIVIAACGFIILCAVNKDVAKQTAQLTGALGLYLKAKAEEEQTDSNASSTQATQEDAAAMESSEGIFDELLADAASTVSSYTVIETKPKEYSEYEKDWNSTGIDKDIVSEATQPLVNQDLSEDSTDETTYYNITDNLTGFTVLQQNIITLESVDEVKQMTSDLSMGNMGKDLTFDSLYYPYYHMLTSNCKQLYKQLYANALEVRSDFFPVIQATPNEWKNAFTSMLYDHPELFWVNTKMYTEYDYNGKVVRVHVEYYNEELGDITEARAQFDEMVSKMLEGAGEIKSAYDKEVYVHNLLADKLTYTQNPLDQSAYSAIVNDETVCAGYSKAFQYLMQKMEIPTYFVVGWGGGLVSGDMHAWNMIKLDKAYYNVDVTWDDQDPVNYNYFNQSDKDFHRHIRMYNSQYLPEAKGGKLSKAPKQ